MSQPTKWRRRRAAAAATTLARTADIPHRLLCHTCAARQANSQAGGRRTPAAGLLARKWRIAEQFARCLRFPTQGKNFVQKRGGSALFRHETKTRAVPAGARVHPAGLRGPKPGPAISVSIWTNQIKQTSSNRPIRLGTVSVLPASLLA